MHFVDSCQDRKECFYIKSGLTGKEGTREDFAAFCTFLASDISIFISVAEIRAVCNLTCAPKLSFAI